MSSNSEHTKCSLLDGGGELGPLIGTGHFS